MTLTENSFIADLEARLENARAIIARQREEFEADWRIAKAQKQALEERIKELEAALEHATIVRVQESERVKELEAVLTEIEQVAIHGCGTRQKDIRGRQFGKICDLAKAALAGGKGEK